MIAIVAISALLAGCIDSRSYRLNPLAKGVTARGSDFSVCGVIAARASNVSIPANLGAGGCFSVVALHVVIKSGLFDVSEVCATCALTGAVAELIMEIIFSPIGYRITTKWKEKSVGKEYLDCVEGEKGI